MTSLLQELAVACIRISNVQALRSALAKELNYKNISTRSEASDTKKGPLSHDVFRRLPALLLS